MLGAREVINKFILSVSEYGWRSRIWLDDCFTAMGNLVNQYSGDTKVVVRMFAF